MLVDVGRSGESSNSYTTIGRGGQYCGSARHVHDAFGSRTRGVGYDDPFDYREAPEPFVRWGRSCAQRFGYEIANA